MNNRDTGQKRRRQALLAAPLACLALTSATIAGVAFWPIGPLWPFKGGHLDVTYWTLDSVGGRQISMHVNLSQPESWDNDCIGRLDLDETPASVKITAYRRIGGHHCSRRGCVIVKLHQPLGTRHLLRGIPTATDPNHAQPVAALDEKLYPRGRLCPLTQDG